MRKTIFVANRKMVLWISLGALICLLCGCFPIHENYYEPSSEGLNPQRQTCHNESGPYVDIGFETGNGKITVSAKQSNDRQGIVSIELDYTVASSWQKDGFKRHRLYKAEESILDIHPSEFVAYGATPSTRLKLTPRSILEINAGNGLERPLPSILHLRSLSSNGHTWFILYFDVELNAEHEFSVVVPQFTIDEETSMSRTIKFVEKNGIWLEPLNC